MIQMWQTKKLGARHNFQKAEKSQVCITSLKFWMRFHSQHDKILNFCNFHRNLLRVYPNFLSFSHWNNLWRFLSDQWFRTLFGFQIAYKLHNILQLFWRLVWIIVVTCKILQFPLQSSRCLTITIFMGYILRADATHSPT